MTLEIDSPHPNYYYSRWTVHDIDFYQFLEFFRKDGLLGFQNGLLGFQKESTHAKGKDGLLGFQNGLLGFQKESSSTQENKWASEFSKWASAQHNFFIVV